MIHLPSDSDSRKLQEMYRAFKRMPQNKLRHVEEHVEGAPDVYMVHAASGVPARSSAFPGSAVCSVYKLLRVQDVGTGTSTAEELVTAGFTQLVYNAADVAVPADSYTLAVRDKYGTWWILSTGGSSAFSGVFVSGGDIAGTADLAPVSPGVEDTVLFDSEAALVDTDSYLRPDNLSQFVVPTDGVYCVQAEMQLQDFLPNGASGTYRGLSIAIVSGGIVTNGFTMRANPALTGDSFVSVQYWFFCFAGYAVELRVSHDADASLFIVQTAISVERKQQL